MLCNARYVNERWCNRQNVSVNRTDTERACATAHTGRREPSEETAVRYHSVCSLESLVNQSCECSGKRSETYARTLRIALLAEQASRKGGPPRRAAGNWISYGGTFCVKRFVKHGATRGTTPGRPGPGGVPRRRPPAARCVAQGLPSGRADGWPSALDKRQWRKDGTAKSVY